MRTAKSITIVATIAALAGCATTPEPDPPAAVVEAPTLPTSACADAMNDAATTGGDEARAALIAALDRCESEPDFLAAVDDHPLAFGVLDADDARAAARVELAAACAMDEHAGTPVCVSVLG